MLFVNCVTVVFSVVLCTCLNPLFVLTVDSVSETPMTTENISSNENENDKDDTTIVIIIVFLAIISIFLILIWIVLVITRRSKSKIVHDNMVNHQRYLASISENDHDEQKMGVINGNIDNNQFHNYNVGISTLGADAEVQDNINDSYNNGYGENQEFEENNMGTDVHGDYNNAQESQLHAEGAINRITGQDLANDNVNEINMVANDGDDIQDETGNANFGVQSEVDYNYDAEKNDRAIRSRDEGNGEFVDRLNQQAFIEENVVFDEIVNHMATKGQQ